MAKTGVIEAEQLDLASITRDVELQPREHLNSETVEQYAEAMGEGAIFPAVRVYFDGERYWLSQGFHRAAAAEKAGLVAILAVVVEGDRQAALWDAAGSNCEHDTSGVRRSNADKRRAVEMALKARPDLSDREIAEQAGVSNAMVSRQRPQTRGLPATQTRTIRRGDQTYTMNVGNIGSRPDAEPMPSLPWRNDGLPVRESAACRFGQQNMTLGDHAGVEELEPPSLVEIDRLSVTRIHAARDRLVQGIHTREDVSIIVAILDEWTDREQSE